MLQYIVGIAICIGIDMIVVWLTDCDFDRYTAICVTGFATATFICCAGHTWPDKLLLGLLIGAGCNFAAPILGGVLFWVVDLFAFYSERAIPWIVGVCISLSVVVVIFGGVLVHREENLVPSSETTVSETRYDVAVGTSVGRVSGAVRGNRWHTGACLSEGEYYKVFVYGEENGETTINPLLLPARDTKIIITDQEGVLVKVEETFYIEDRNYDPYKKEVNYVETTYRLYVSEADVVGFAGT